MHKDPLIGTTVSHYKIVDYLGGGGMGVVYKAEDTKLKRTVALKFLPVELTRTSDAKARFEKEAQAASALDHPRIGTIYEINETDDGHMYIAMAYYEGKTLKDKMDGKPMPVTQAIELITQIANGLASAHEKGIIHRDIKPANIIITDEGFVKIVDFGLAKLDDTTRLTKSGMAMGTPAYMSPEQAKGKEVDHKSDIWALGVIFYELLTGKLPFQGDNDMSMLYNIVNESPAPVTQFNSKIPPQLAKIIDKTISKDREIRYATVTQFIDDLRALPLEPMEEAKTVILKKQAKGKAEPKSQIIPDDMKTVLVSDKKKSASQTKPRKSRMPVVILSAVLLAVILGILNGSKIKGIFEPSTSTGYINIDSEPKGATILLDGEESGKTTPALLGPMISGEYNISLAAPGFENWTKMVNVTENDTILKIAKLLQISQDQPVAAKSGDLQIIEKPVAETETDQPKERRPEPKKTVRQPAASQPLVGSLNIDSQPKGALIFLNGNSTGFKTPHLFTRLKPNRYDIQLTLDGYESAKSTSNIKAGTQENLNLQLQKAAPGQLFVQVFVLEGNRRTRYAEKISVIIDGKEVGTGWRTYSLKSGIHRINAKWPGYKLKDGEQQIQIMSGQNHKIELVFVKE